MNGTTIPIKIRVHPMMAEELQVRKEELEKITGYKLQGGLPVISHIAALELKRVRSTGQKILEQINTHKKETRIFTFNNEQYVKLEDWNKLLTYLKSLSKKKDTEQIKLEIHKIKGIKKNEIVNIW
jgi:uncharacterized protein HemY